jgi:hypothetical protein
MNLYGFAGGDPVNFSDPFGLCPIEKDGIPCVGQMALAGTVTGAMAGAVVGATGGSLVVPGVGTIAGGGGGALLGAGAGLISGFTVGAARDVTSLLEMSGLGGKIKRKLRTAAEAIALAVGIATSDMPPKKPDDEENPPPPVPTSTKSLAPDRRDKKPEP